ncbi:uncharacterized protein J3D65DRAFT_260116 [Phyllosticta citribraziliensis]|uniref:Uncharacterized protein n=1 Tax=Phyllosticta citribraziliensis TaxID=989973 RepID=A0ABR1M297_9PEZI
MELYGGDAGEVEDCGACPGPRKGFRFSSQFGLCLEVGFGGVRDVKRMKLESESDCRWRDKGRYSPSGVGHAYLLELGIEKAVRQLNICVSWGRIHVHVCRRRTKQGVAVEVSGRRGSSWLHSKKSVFWWSKSVECPLIIECPSHMASGLSAQQAQGKAGEECGGSCMRTTAGTGVHARFSASDGIGQVLGSSSNEARAATRKPGLCFPVGRLS